MQIRGSIFDLTFILCPHGCSPLERLHRKSKRLSDTFAKWVLL